MILTLETKIRSVEKQLQACGERIAAETNRTPQDLEKLKAYLDQRSALELALLELQAIQRSKGA